MYVYMYAISRSHPRRVFRGFVHLVFLCPFRIFEKTGIMEPQGNCTTNGLHRVRLHKYMYTACPLICNHYHHRLEGLEEGLLGSSGSWRSPSASLCFSNRRSWRLTAANRWAVVTANRWAVVTANRWAVVTANRWAASRSSGLLPEARPVRGRHTPRRIASAWLPRRRRHLLRSSALLTLQQPLRQLVVPLLLCVVRWCIAVLVYSRGDGVGLLQQLSNRGMAVDGSTPLRR